MADGTLTPVGFNNPIVKTNMEPQERFAMACILGGDPDNTQASLVRELLKFGLEALGWSEAERIKRYAEYRLHCLENQETNVFESE